MQLMEKPVPYGRPCSAISLTFYDILQSKEDKATVTIYCEARLAKIAATCCRAPGRQG
jgi:hypothetical protein